MTNPTTCPECSASWLDGDQTCPEHFYQMGYWDLEHALYEVHHLMVLCYHLQHPALYSPEGLAGAIQMLVQFVEEGVSPQDMRRRMGKAVDSGQREYKIKGTPEAHGAYTRPVAWTMTAADVTAAGVERYDNSVRAWAQSVLDALRASGNLA